MVVFTCNHCGDSLQKPRVEKHYNTQCRRPKSLTCVDCFKDFKDEEYVVHIKCITEEERYAAKGSIPTGIVKKGEVKQESWINMIRSIVNNEENNMKPSLKNLFHTISTYTNVPRKRNKFLNFLQNSLGRGVNLADVESAWDLIEKYKHDQLKTNKEDKNESGENELKRKLNGHNDEIPNKKKKVEENEEKADGNDKQNGHSDEIKKKKSKQKQQSAEEEPEVFSFKNTIYNILKEKGSISMKKLQKKVLNKYVEETGCDSTEKTIKKYNKKLRKLANVIINDDVVSLTS